jgi:hypothetical protein
MNKFMKQNEKMKAMLQQIICWQIIHFEKMRKRKTFLKKSNLQVTPNSRKKYKYLFGKKFSKANVLRNNAF